MNNERPDRTLQVEKRTATGLFGCGILCHKSVLNGEVPLLAQWARFFSRIGSIASARRIWFAAVFSLIVPSLVGCNVLKPFIFIGEHKKKISPEFDKLPDRKVAVVVWMDQSILFDYPNARAELAAYVADKLSVEMKQRELGTDVVSPKEVELWVSKNAASLSDPVKAGRHFAADYVISVEVVELEFRSPEHPQVLQGRINASISVYDVRSGRERGERFALAPVDCVYPAGAPVMMNASNAVLIREATYHQFAELVARKFYEHTVDL
jgi:hypothetical protein